MQTLLNFVKNLGTLFKDTRSGAGSEALWGHLTAHYSVDIQICQQKKKQMQVPRVQEGTFEGIVRVSNSNSEWFLSNIAKNANHRLACLDERRAAYNEGGSWSMIQDETP